MDPSTQATQPPSTINRFVYWSKRLIVSLLIVVHHILAFAPIMAALLVSMLWLYASSILGHPARTLVDDPKYIAPYDWLYNFMFDSISNMFIWADIIIVGFLLLTLVLLWKYPPRWTLLLLVTFALGAVLIWVDPFRHFYWFWD